MLSVVFQLTEKGEIEEVVVGKDSTCNNCNCAQKPFPDLMPY